MYLVSMSSWQPPALVWASVICLCVLTSNRFVSILNVLHPEVCVLCISLLLLALVIWLQLLTIGPGICLFCVLCDCHRVGLTDWLWIYLAYIFLLVLAIHIRLLSLPNHCYHQSQTHRKFHFATPSSLLVKLVSTSDGLGGFKRRNARALVANKWVSTALVYGLSTMWNPLETDRGLERQE